MLPNKLKAGLLELMKKKGEKVKIGRSWYLRTKYYIIRWFEP